MDTLSTQPEECGLKPIMNTPVPVSASRKNSGIIPAHDGTIFLKAVEADVLETFV